MEPEWIKKCPDDKLRILLASLITLKGSSETSTIRRLVIKDEDVLDSLIDEVQKDLTSRKSDAARLLEQLVSNKTTA